MMASVSVGVAPVLMISVISVFIFLSRSINLVHARKLTRCGRLRCNRSITYFPAGLLLVKDPLWLLISINSL